MPDQAKLFYHLVAYHINVHSRLFFSLFQLENKAVPPLEYN